MSVLKQFVKSYWEYFLELEEQFLETKRFVDFDKTNAKAYSIEYLKLYQAVCSEIDVVGKEIAIGVNPSFKIDNSTTIRNWGYEIQKVFPKIKDTEVTFNDEESVHPFINWEYEPSTKTNKNGVQQTRIHIKDGKETILWWRNYNKIKHRRIGLVEGTKNFQLANQGNLIQAFAALFLLEMIYIDSFSKSEIVTFEKSKLFIMSNKST